MKEYRERDKPTATSAEDHQGVVLNSWQKIVAEFDAEMADGKETFNRNPTPQTVKDEYAIYVMSALSAGSTFDTLGFWKVRFLHIHRDDYSHKFSTDARAYFSNHFSDRNGLFAHTSIRCTLRKGFFVECGD